MLKLAGKLIHGKPVEKLISENRRPVNENVLRQSTELAQKTSRLKSLISSASRGFLFGRSVPSLPQNCECSRSMPFGMVSAVENGGGSSKCPIPSGRGDVSPRLHQLDIDFAVGRTQHDVRGLRRTGE